MKYTNTPYYAWYFTATTLVANPLPNFQGANCINLQQFKLDFRYMIILQRLWAKTHEDIYQFNSST